MKTQLTGIPWRSYRKLFLVVLLVILALQSFGLNGLAAPSASTEGYSAPLQCTSPLQDCNFQIILMIDDSGSIRNNDRNYDRNESARKVISALASSPNLPNVQLAVIHFSSETLDQSSSLEKFDPSKKEVLSAEIDKNKQYDYFLQTTNFAPPFDAAAKLFADADAKQTSGDCNEKYIFVFTDGTPEIGSGPLTGQALQRNLGVIKAKADALSPLNLRIVYFTGNSIYSKLTEVRQLWAEISKELPDTDVDVYSAEQFTGRINEITKLAGYQKTNIVIDSPLGPFQPGKENVIKFRLLDGSGSPIVPEKVSPYKLDLTTTITQGAQGANPAKLSQEGDGYLVSWTPVSEEAGQLNVHANLINDSGRNVLDCSGTIALGYLPGETNSIVLTLVVGSPKLLVVNDSVTLPLYLDYKGNKSTASSLDWHPTAKNLDTGQSLKASVSPGNKTPGEYTLTISDIGDATRIEAQVSADAVIDEQLVPVTAAPTSFELSGTSGCDCTTGLWGVWFWPLAIVLAGLLILLLVFGIWHGRQNKGMQGRSWLYLRRGDWHFLFWPLLVLFFLLILVRVFHWCCIIPLWLFLASFLTWLVMLVLVSFTPESDSRPRPWWLVLLLLLLIPVWYFVLPLQWPFLLMIDMLVLAWLILWWRPTPAAPVGISLSLDSPRLPPVNDSITVPIKLNFKGNRNAPSSLHWRCSIQSASPLASWKITPDRSDVIEYELELYGVEKAGLIEVELSAEIEIDNLYVETPPVLAMIPIQPSAPSAPPYLVLGNTLPSYVHAQESISLPLQVVYSGDRAWTSSLEWFSSVNGKAGGGAIKPVNQETGEYQFVVDPVSDGDRIEVMVGAKAVLDGRPIELSDRKATVQILSLPVIPIPLPPLILSLVMPPACVPSGESISLPLYLEFQGDRSMISSLTWNPSARTNLGGEIKTNIVTINEENGEYELRIDPVSDASEIQLQVCADAVIDGRAVEILGKTIAIKICPVEKPDDLTILEGIEADVLAILHQHGVYTFHQLAYTELWKLNQWLKGSEYDYMDPKTWPQQARLADIAKTSGKDDDWASFKGYLKWVKDGVEPDERKVKKDLRRPVALEWHGTATLTKEAYPDIKFP